MPPFYILAVIYFLNPLKSYGSLLQRCVLSCVSCVICVLLYFFQTACHLKARQRRLPCYLTHNWMKMYPWFSQQHFVQIERNRIAEFPSSADNRYSIREYPVGRYCFMQKLSREVLPCVYIQYGVPYCLEINSFATLLRERQLNFQNKYHFTRNEIQTYKNFLYQLCVVCEEIFGGQKVKCRTPFKSHNITTLGQRMVSDGLTDTIIHMDIIRQNRWKNLKSGTFIQTKN